METAVKNKGAKKFEVKDTTGVNMLVVGDGIGSQIDRVIDSIELSDSDMLSMAGEMTKEWMNTVDESVFKGSTAKEVYAKAKAGFLAEIKEEQRFARVKDLVCLLDGLDSVDDNEVMAGIRGQIAEIAKGKDFACYCKIEKADGEVRVLQYDGTVLNCISDSGLGAKVLPLNVFIDRYNCSMEKVVREKFRSSVHEDQCDSKELFDLYRSNMIKESAAALSEDADHKSGWDGNCSERGSLIATEMMSRNIEKAGASLALRNEKKAIRKAVKSGGVEWFK